MNLVLTARTEGALGHFFHDVVAADGFDDFFLGFVAIIFIVMMLVAMMFMAVMFMIMGGSMFVVRRRGVMFIGVLAVFGMNSIVSMGGVFARLLVVGALVMAMVFMPLFIMSMFFMDFRACRCRSLDRHRNRHIGRGRNGRCLVRVGMIVLVMRVVMLVSVVMIMIVRMFTIMMMLMIVMPGIGVVMTGFQGIVSVAVVGVHAFGMLERLSGLRRIEAAFSTISLWTRSPLPRRRELRWRGRR